MRAGGHDPTSGCKDRGIDLPRDDKMHRVQRPQRNIRKGRNQVYCSCGGGRRGGMTDQEAAAERLELREAPDIICDIRE